MKKEGSKNFPRDADMLKIAIHKQMLSLYRGYGVKMVLLFIYNWLTFPHKTIEKYVPKSGFIYDLGCGHGIFANFVTMISKDRRVIGIEKDRTRFKIARNTISRIPQRGKLDFILGDILKVKVDYCDVMLLNDVLHHLPSYKSQRHLLKKCRDNLKKDGRLIVVEVDTKPFHKFLITFFLDHIYYLGHKIRYRSNTSLLKLLSSLEFDVKAVRLHKGYIIPNVLYICRKKRR